jgi:hypothetical protein
MNNMVSSRYHPRYVLIVGEAMKLQLIILLCFPFHWIDGTAFFDDDDYIRDVLI